jgi:hypothetical protein
VPEVCLLGLPHQEERHGKDGEGPEVNGRVAEEDDAGDEAVDEVVRDEPSESLLERAPPQLMTFDGGGEADEPHVDDEVGEPGGDACGDRQDPARITCHVHEVQRKRAYRRN